MTQLTERSCTSTSLRDIRHLLQNYITLPWEKFEVRRRGCTSQLALW